MATTIEIAPAPILSSEKHDGVPVRLEAEAERAKNMIHSSRTLPPSIPRQDSTAPRLPPAMSRQAFDVAIEDIRQSLGKENVEVNDKPLVDGWYMEHP